MKTINLFGLKLQFEIKRNKYSDEKATMNIIKIIYINFSLKE